MAEKQKSGSKMKESFILENLMLFIRYRILFENAQNILFQSSYFKHILGDLLA